MATLPGCQAERVLLALRDFRTRSGRLRPSTRIAAFPAANTIPPVPAHDTAATSGKFGSIGRELAFYIDQQIIDNFTLTLYAAYLCASDAFYGLPFNSVAPGAFITKNGGIDPGRYLTPGAFDSWEQNEHMRVQLNLLQWKF